MAHSVHNGLTSLDELKKAAIRACNGNECIHHEGEDITPEMVVHSILAADGEGRRRKGGAMVAE